MNIYYLDEDPKTCAKYHFDAHVEEMLVKSAQMLSTAHRVLDGAYKEVEDGDYIIAAWDLPDEDMNVTLYRTTHVDEPISIWVRESDKNYQYLYELFEALSEEFHYRFGREHGLEHLLPALQQKPDNIPVNEGTPVRIIASEDVSIVDPVAAYRYYYFHEKSHLFLYSRRHAPKWYKSPFGK